jgi:hypothetical protein
VSVAGKGKREKGPAAAVEGFVAGLELEGAEDVLGRVAVDLAGALEEAPLYAKARLARELRELVAQLKVQAVKKSEQEARRRQRRPVRQNGREVAELEEMANRRLRETGALGDGDG